MLTLAGGVPFVGTSRGALEDAITILFDDAGTQAFLHVLTAMFIFLLLLALRNFFKYK